MKWPSSASVRALLVLCTLGPTSAAAQEGEGGSGPEERFYSGLQECGIFGANDVDCRVCGASVTCSGDECSAGPIRFNRQTNFAAIDHLLKLYCNGSGGVLLASAGAAGVQTQTASAVFRRIEHGRGGSLSVGAVVEFSHFGKGPTATEVGGTRLPGSYDLIINDRTTLDLSGNLIVGFGDGIQQWGLNANPALSYHLLGRGNAQALQVLVGGALPFQFVGTTGDGLDFGAAWYIGASVFGAVSKRFGPFNVGGALIFDGRYDAGAAVPLQVLWRASVDPAHMLRNIAFLSGITNIVLQQGWSMELAAGSAIPDTMRINTMVGFEFGNWVCGYQGFFLDGSSAHGIGCSRVSKPTEMVTGLRDHVEEGKKEKVMPDITKPTSLPATRPVTVKPARDPSSQPTLAPTTLGPTTKPATKPAPPTSQPTSQPAASQPTSQPAASQPTSQPAASQPAASQPAASQPTSQPAASQPSQPTP